MSHELPAWAAAGRSQQAASTSRKATRKTGREAAVWRVLNHNFMIFS
jgi:hypothetical protein